MLLSEDTVVALSWSGETPELASIIEYAGRFRLNLIAITSNADSALGRAADLVLKLPAVPEACLHGLAATNSALVQMAIGDALAIALQELRGFTAEDFLLTFSQPNFYFHATTAYDIIRSFGVEIGNVRTNAQGQVSGVIRAPFSGAIDLSVTVPLR